MRSAELGLNNGTERGRRGGDDAIFRFFLMSGDDGFWHFSLVDTERHQLKILSQAASTVKLKLYACLGITDACVVIFVRENTTLQS